MADFGAARWPDRRLVLAGFSFGAFVALRLALARDAARLITVAPPVGRFDFSELRAAACPWLVVQGDADDVVDPQCRDRLGRAPGPRARAAWSCPESGTSSTGISPNCATP